MRGLTVARELRLEPPPAEEGKLELLTLVRFPHLFVRDELEALPERVFGVDVVQVTAVGLIQAPERLADPRRRVDTVGDAEDGLVRDCRPCRVRRLSVKLAYGVG